jgi:hypothetical protein
LVSTPWYYRFRVWLTRLPFVIRYLRPTMWRGWSPLKKAGDAQGVCPVPGSLVGTSTVRRYQP